MRPNNAKAQIPTHLGSASCAAVAGKSTHRRGLLDRLISRNSRPARSASASSKGRSCRHCSDHRKSQAGRNSASRHRTRNNLGPDRYTRGAGRGAPGAKTKLSGSKPEGCCSVAADSRAGSRSRASAAPAVYERALPARRPAAATGRQQSMATGSATSPHHRRPAVATRFKSGARCGAAVAGSLARRSLRGRSPQRSN